MRAKLNTFVSKIFLFAMKERMSASLPARRMLSRVYSFPTASLLDTTRGGILADLAMMALPLLALAG
jgi:hypothetical protein